MRAPAPRRGARSGTRFGASFGFAWALLAALVLTGVTRAQPLERAEGAVEIRPSAEAPWRPASSGEALEPGGSLRTFAGTAALTVDGGRALLAPRSELSRAGAVLRLDAGRAHVIADDVRVALGGQVRIVGEARVDVDPEFGSRAGVLAGTVRATVGGRVIDLAPGQQVIVDPGGDPRVADFVERDPWYLGLVASARGDAEVLNVEGRAELLAAEAGDPEAGDDAWRPAEPGDRLEPGDRVRTGEASWIEFRFAPLGDAGARTSLLRILAESEAELVADDRLEVEEGGEVGREGGGERRTVVRLLRGTAWAVVEGSDDRFEIETPGLVAAVRGTTFRVDGPGAEGTDAPRVKTFDGVVAGIVGFDAVSVEEGQQLTPDEGLEPLERDDLDAFNLERDRLVRRPELELRVPGGLLTSDSAQVELTSDEPARLELRSAATDASATASESLELTAELPLERGFNLIVARGSFGGAATVRAAPVVTSGGTPFVAVEARERGAAALLRWRGVAPAGSAARVRRADDDAILQRAAVGADGRFALTLPATTSGALRLEIDGPAGRTVLPLPGVPGADGSGDGSSGDPSGDPGDDP